MPVLLPSFPNSFRFLFAIIGLCLAGCSSPGGPPAAQPRWAADSASVQLSAGPQYARGAVWRYFWGSHYRTWWAAPVTVPVIRLGTVLPGGVLAAQAGGSYQSHTLRLQAPAGGQYLLRSVDKDGSAALPAGWRRRLLGSLMKDQTSAGLPFGAYIAARLAQAAGVYHTNPKLVYLPDDPSLGKFRAGFANALYLWEERPEGDQRRQPSFGCSPAVVNSARMLRELRRNPGAHVVDRAYLRARLLDMWLGDWSRREDQWRWASFPESSGRLSYRPIPRDRDQAFFLFDDGLITGLVAWFIPKYQSFHAPVTAGAVDGLTRTARTLDRTLLATLSADDFRQEADSLVRRLSDRAIADALAATPAEAQAAIAARLGPLLRARRAQLPAMAQQYYQLLAKEAWLVGTDQPERFVLSQTKPGKLRVQVYARQQNGSDTLVSDRTYNPEETPLLQLYGLGGEDIFELQSAIPAAMRVEACGGKEHDQVEKKTAGPVGNFIWLTGADNGDKPAPAGISSKPDPQPELTGNGAAWLNRYNLHD